MKGQKCKFCGTLMDCKVYRIEEGAWCPTEELDVCPNCGATYDFFEGEGGWLTLAEQIERCKAYDEYSKTHQQGQNTTQHHETTDELPW